MKKISILVSLVVLFSFGTTFALAQSSNHVVVMKTMKKVVKKKTVQKVVKKKVEKKVEQKKSTLPTTVMQTVNIENFAFAPAIVTVKKGETVEFVQKDSIGHTVTADDGSGSGLSSALLDKGESYKFKFDKVGTWTYHCGPHPSMQGTVVVTE